MFIGSFATFIFGILVIASINDKDVTKSLRFLLLGLFLFFLGLITWDMLAMREWENDPTHWVITNHEIKVMYNSPFYFDRDMKPHGLEGAEKFADPTKTVVQIKTLTGGWQYGIYVTES